MPKKYRLIVIDVMAIQVLPENIERAVQWCNGVAATEIDPGDSKRIFVGVNVPTMRGVVRASHGDYIVKTAQGFEVMGKNEFESKYQLVG